MFRGHATGRAGKRWIKGLAEGACRSTLWSSRWSVGRIDAASRGKPHVPRPSKEGMRVVTRHRPVAGPTLRKPSEWSPPQKRRAGSKRQPAPSLKEERCPLAVEGPETRGRLRAFPVSGVGRQVRRPWRGELSASGEVDGAHLRLPLRVHADGRAGLSFHIAEDQAGGPVGCQCHDGSGHGPAVREHHAGSTVR